MTEAITRESRLVARTAAPESAVGEGALASEGIDWGRVWRIAAEERAIAPVWRRIRQRREAMTDRVANEFQRAAMISDFQMGLLWQRCQELIGGLQGAGVPCLPLKGAAIALKFGGSFADRPMGDLDLLVPPEHASSARALALAMGWKEGPFADQVGFYEGHHHLAPLVDKSGSGANLEIHTELFADGHPFAFSAAECWRLARTQHTAIGDIPLLTPEAMVTHLVIHLAWAHSFRGGAWRAWYDLHRLIRVVHWPALDALVRTARAGSCAYWVLRLARQLGGCPIPDGSVKDLSPNLPTGLLNRLELHFTHQILAGQPCPSRGLERALWRLGIQPGRSGHGAARPWDRDATFEFPTDLPRASPPRISRWRRFTALAEYCGRILRSPHRDPGAG